MLLWKVNKKKGRQDTGPTEAGIPGIKSQGWCKINAEPVTLPVILYAHLPLAA